MHKIDNHVHYYKDIMWHLRKRVTIIEDKLNRYIRGVNWSNKEYELAYGQHTYTIRGTRVFMIYLRRKGVVSKLKKIYVSHLYDDTFAVKIIGRMYDKSHFIVDLEDIFDFLMSIVDDENNDPRFHKVTSNYICTEHWVFWKIFSVVGKYASGYTCTEMSVLNGVNYYYHYVTKDFIIMTTMVNETLLIRIDTGPLKISRANNFCDVSFVTVE